MKLLTRLALFCAALLSQSAWADLGPYYVSYPGFCNVKKVYISNIGGVYGTEVSCASIMGAPLAGLTAPDGTVSVAMSLSGVPCIAAYRMDLSLTVACTNATGGPLGYANTTKFTVQQNTSSPADSQRTLQYNVSTEMPNLELTRDLPPMQP
jgi:hypothetical protein